MLEEGTKLKIIGAATTIADETDISGALLFKLVRENLLRVAGSGAPVNPAGEITSLVLANIEEFNPRTSLASGDSARENARTARLNGYTPKA